MSWLSLSAIFFIVWWVMLFVSLPIGLRTQEEEGDVVLGTTPSAPRGPHMLRAVLRATLFTAIAVVIYALLTQGLGFSLEDVPRIVPQF